MKTLMYRFLSFIKWTSIKKGVKKGFSIGMLPNSINNLYNLPVVRVLRVIGGISTFLLLTKNYLYLPKFLGWIIIILGILQILQIIIINVIRIIYGIKKIKKNSDEFDVRNSPLDKYATSLAKYIYCWKIGCTVLGSGVGIITVSAALDEALDAANKQKMFLPLIGKGLGSILGSNNNELTTYKDIQNKLDELRSAESRSNSVSNYIELLSTKNLNNLSESDKIEITKALQEVSKANDEELKSLKGQILSEIQKLNPSNTKLNSSKSK